MKKYEIISTVIGTKIVVIKASSKQKAEEKWLNDDYSQGDIIDYSETDEQIDEITEQK